MMAAKKIVSLAGRPALYDSEEELQSAIEAYFAETGAASTITGLAYDLGFQSRQSFYDYEESGKFSYIIKRARLFIESCYETKLSANNPTGPIFFLKNMGWKDKTEVDNTIHMHSPPVINITTAPVLLPVSDNEE